MFDIVVYDLEEQGIKTIKASLIMFNWDGLTYEAYNRDGEIIYKGKVDNIGIIEEVREEQSKSCINCKYYSNKNSVYACTCSNGICGVDNEHWEAKDNG